MSTSNIVLAADRSIGVGNQPNAAHCFLNILAAVERAEPDVSLSAPSKSTTWGAHDMRLAQQPIEELPAWRFVGSFHPHIGRVCSAIELHSQFLQPFANDPGIVHVKID